jgi:large subunit ribosomal protein L35
MPKIKTHKSTSKRFRLTGSGKLTRTHLGKSHLRRKKSKRVSAALSEMQVVVAKGQIKRVRKLAPYLKQK